MRTTNDDEIYAAELELLESLRAVGTPPCKTCKLRQFCATEPAACGEFIDWVENGPVPSEPAPGERNADKTNALRQRLIALYAKSGRHPSRDLYDYLNDLAPFGSDDDHPWTRRLVLDALRVEARERASKYHKGYLFPQRRLTEAQVRAYYSWLEEKGVRVTPAAMLVLLSRLGDPGYTKVEIERITGRKPIRV